MHSEQEAAVSLQGNKEEVGKSMSLLRNEWNIPKEVEVKVLHSPSGRVMETRGQ